MARLLTAALVGLLLCTTSSNAQNAALPIVYVLSTGGTIAGQGSSATDLSNYKSGSLLGEALVNAVPQIKQVADVRVEQIVNVNSSDITLDNWLTLARRIQKIMGSFNGSSFTNYATNREGVVKGSVLTIDTAGMKRPVLNVDTEDMLG